jgi:hypothetical protein
MTNCRNGSTSRRSLVRAQHGPSRSAGLFSAPETFPKTPSGNAGLTGVRPALWTREADRFKLSTVDDGDAFHDSERRAA